MNNRKCGWKNPVFLLGGFVAWLAGPFLLAGCVSLDHQLDGGPAAKDELKVVPRVDIQRYLGTWYEIARYPHGFEENCYASQAEYSLREDGDIQVVNRCWLGGFEGEGELEEAVGKAWVVDHETNAKLRVRFFWPFSGAYWILELDPEYRHAVVGHPSRKYLWILSRQRRMEPELFQGLVQKIRNQGYDPSRIIRTPQPPPS